MYFKYFAEMDMNERAAVIYLLGTIIYSTLAAVVFEVSRLTN